MANKILTPITLWNDFDDSLPLNIETDSESERDGVKYSEISFSGRAVGSDRVRIRALLACPAEGGDKPSVLIVPDADKTYDEALAARFVSLGYSVLMPDYRGRQESAGRYTLYPDSVSYANFAEAGRRILFADETAKETAWYEWVAVARYSLRVLCELKPTKPVGAVGIKAGGDIVWQLAATAEGLACAVPVCAGGWLAYRGIKKFGENTELKMDEERYRFLGGVDAQAYAQHVKCPILMLCSTNDSRFDADRAFDTFARIAPEQEKAFYFSARYDGHIGNTAFKDMELFLDKYLKKYEVFVPKPIDISIEEEDGALVAKICFDPNGEVKYCEAFMAEDNFDAATRDWTRCKHLRDDGDDTSYFALDAYSGAKTVFAFAKAKYSSGFAVSSKIAVKRIDKVYSNMQPKTRILFSSLNGTDSFTMDKYDNNVVADCFLDNSIKPIRLVNGPYGIKGVYSSYGLRSYRLGTERYRPYSGAIIKFDAYAQASALLTVTIAVLQEGKADRYVCGIALPGGEEWTACDLSAKDFKNDVGKPLAHFSDGAYITFSSPNLFCINNFLWL